jgi:hypothetical protein
VTRHNVDERHACALPQHTVCQSARPAPLQAALVRHQRAPLQPCTTSASPHEIPHSTRSHPSHAALPLPCSQLRGQPHQGARLRGPRAHRHVATQEPYPARHPAAADQGTRRRDRAPAAPPARTAPTSSERCARLRRRSRKLASSQRRHRRTHAPCGSACTSNTMSFCCSRAWVIVPSSPFVRPSRTYLVQRFLSGNRSSFPPSLLSVRRCSARTTWRCRHGPCCCAATASTRSRRTTTRCDVKSDVAWERSVTWCVRDV